MASLSPSAKQLFLNNSGQPAAGYSLYTYQTGTSTPLATYLDSAGATPNANPVVLDARGEAIVYLLPQQYRYVLKDTLGATVWTRDNVSPPAEKSDILSVFSGSTGASQVGFLQLGTGAKIRNSLDKMREQVSVKDFGAIGDGGSHPLSTVYGTLAQAQAVYPFATSLSDEIDWAAFQAAAGNAGTHIFVPSGIYIINRAVVITNEQVSFSGDNRLAPTVKTSSLTDDIFRVSCGTTLIHGVSLKYLFLDATAPKTGGSGISVNASSGGTLYWGSFEHIDMSVNMAYGLTVQSCFFLSLSDITIVGIGANKIGFNFQGIDTVSRVVEVTMRNLKVLTGTSGGNTIGMLIGDHCEGMYGSIISTASLGLDYGIQIVNTNGIVVQGPKNIFFQNVVCDNHSKNGLDISGVQTARFTDLWTTSCQITGLNIFKAVDLEIKGLSCLANGQDGVRIGAAASQVRILGGAIAGNSASAANSYAGVNVTAGASYWTVRDIDFLYSNGGASHFYDIYINGGASANFIITNNRTYGGVTGAIFDGATGQFKKVIKGNLGFNPTAGGVTTPAVPASTTAVTNITGQDVACYVIGGTVSAIAVGGVFTGQSASPSTVIIPSGTTVQLVYTAAPTWKWFGL